MHELNHIHGGNVIAAAGKYGLRPEDIVDFSASINPIGISGRARKAVVERLDSILHYPEQFADTLTHEIAKFHGIPESCILAGNGSTELIYLIPRVFKPKKALIVIPAFSEYRNALSLAGCEVDTFPLTENDGFAVEMGRLAPVLERKYDILYLCNPGNPTGTLVSKDVVLKIVNEASRNGTICVVDEAFIDFREEESVKREAIETPKMIVLRSMTKFYGIPGMRVGFAISNEDNIGKMMVHKEPWSINVLGSIAAIESLHDASYIEESKSYIARERDYLHSELSKIPWLSPYSSAANYILAKIERDGMDADLLSEHLAKEGLLIRSCTSFGGLGSSFFRVAVRKREENDRLLESLRNIIR